MVKRSPTLGTLVSTKIKCIKLIFIGKITLVPVAFLMALRIFLDKKPRRVFLPFHFVGEKPHGGKTLRGNFLFPLEAQYNAESY